MKTVDIRELISSIHVHQANLDHIARNGCKINGTLLYEIERVMHEYSSSLREQVQELEKKLSVYESVTGIGLYERALKFLKIHQIHNVDVSRSTTPDQQKLIATLLSTFTQSEFESVNVGEKPDFEKMATEFCYACRNPEISDKHSCADFRVGLEHFYNSIHVPVVAKLKEEIIELGLSNAELRSLKQSIIESDLKQLFPEKDISR